MNYFKYDNLTIEQRNYIKKLLKENELLKEELKELKDGIIGVYNNMNSLEIINKHEMEDIEILWNEK